MTQAAVSASTMIKRGIPFQSDALFLLSLSLFLNIVVRCIIVDVVSGGMILNLSDGIILQLRNGRLCQIHFFLIHRFQIEMSRKEDILLQNYS